MPIYSAQSATEQVIATRTATTAAETARTVAAYQSIFDQIEATATRGQNTLDVSINRADYKRLQPILSTSGYTVSVWPVLVEDFVTKQTITISWPIAVADLAILSSILPTDLRPVKNVQFSTVFEPQGGLAPYTITVTDGTIPLGLAWTTTTHANDTLAGIPLLTGSGYFDLTVTDQQGTTVTNRVLWAVTAVSEFVLGSLSGYPQSYMVERSGVGAVGQVMSYGNGSSTSKGVYMPYGGKIYEAVLSATNITGTFTLDLYVNGAIVPGYTLTVTGTNENKYHHVKFITPYEFTQYKQIGWYISAVGSAANAYEVNYFVVYN